MTDVLLILTGYLLGSMPWGYWLPRILKGVNIRKVGSGSTGAANVWRTLGFKIGLGVALLDIAKGFAAAALGLWFGGELVPVASRVFGELLEVRVAVELARGEVASQLFDRRGAAEHDVRPRLRETSG